MDPEHAKHDQKMIQLPRPLRGITRFAGSMLTVDITEACHRCIYVSSRCPIPIGSVGGLVLTLPGSSEQVGLCVVTNFLEQHQNGFGVGAYVSALTTAGRVYWRRYCEQLRNENTCRHAQAMRPQGPCRVLSFEGAVSSSMKTLLQEQGVEVAEFCGQADLLRMTFKQYTQILLADCEPRCLQRLERCLDSFERAERPNLILLSREVEYCEAIDVDWTTQASRVLHVPCSREILVQRLLRMLWAQSVTAPQAPMSLRQIERMEDSMDTCAGQIDFRIEPRPALQHRFAQLEQVPPGETAQFVLAPVRAGLLKMYLRQLWARVRRTVRLPVREPSSRQTELARTG